MACERPIARIEDYNGRVTFESPSFGDAEQLKKWHQRLDNNGYVKSVTMIPCKRCIGCRLDYAKEWANRIVLETMSYEYNYFLTLTYDDEHLHKVARINEDDMITGISTTLDKKDLSDFFKRLRRYYQYHYKQEDIRYYACGEYGSTTERPHYHAIVFNLPIEDMEYHSKSKSGNPQFTSKIIDEIWGKGFVTIGQVNWNSASYVARYVMKKRYGKDAEEYYESIGKLPEFVTMSLKPAIGKKYYDEHKHEIYKHDEIFIPCKGGTKAIKPPVYFDELYQDEYPNEFEKVQRKRRETNRTNTILNAEKLGTVNNIQRQREIKARNLDKKSQFLVREL